jgi:hypothetical protein
LGIWSPFEEIVFNLSDPLKTFKTGLLILTMKLVFFLAFSVLDKIHENPPYPEIIGHGAKRSIEF